MNWLDIVIIVLLVFSIFGGLRAGFVRSLLSLIGVIAGIMLAGRYYPALAQRLAFIPSEQAANITAFVIILLVVMVVAGLLGMLLNWIMSSIMLGWFNSLGGAVLGLVLGALFISAILAMWVKFQGMNDIVKGSGLATFLLSQFPAVLALLPPEFDSVRSFFQ